MNMYQQMKRPDDSSAIVMITPNEQGEVKYRVSGARGVVTITGKTGKDVSVNKQDKVALYPYQNMLRGLSVKEMRLIHQGLLSLNKNGANELADQIGTLITAMDGIK